MIARGSSLRRWLLVGLSSSSRPRRPAIAMARMTARVNTNLLSPSTSRKRGDSAYGREADNEHPG